MARIPDDQIERLKQEVSLQRLAARTSSACVRSTTTGNRGRPYPQTTNRGINQRFLRTCSLLAGHARRSWGEILIRAVVMHRLMSPNKSLQLTQQSCMADY